MKKISRKVFYSLPPALRFTARRLLYLPLDTYEMLTGKRDELTPPKGMIYTGGGNFREVGEQQLGYLKELCGLTQESAVLDIGSGIGRTAIPLTKFLNQKGSYNGFDVVKKGVDWCTKRITSRFPNFHFKYIPLNNDLYRKDGTEAHSFKFPYPENSFDVIVVNSVFTHMIDTEVENYFREMKRVLKSTGKIYATFFLYENDKTAFPKGFDFPFNYGHYRLMDDEVKSANVAFESSYFKEKLVKGNGFQIKGLYNGSWRGTSLEKAMEFQDIAIIEKAG